MDGYRLAHLYLHSAFEDLLIACRQPDLSKKYKQDIIVVEYSEYKTEVNDVAFGLSNPNIKGTFIWEPLNTWEQIFDKYGVSNNLINKYDSIKQKYNIP